MASGRFVAGASLIVLGFVVYEYGFFLTLNLWPTLSGWTLSFVPWIGSVPVMGAVLQLVGGAIGIAGLLSCIAWVGSQSRMRLSASGFRGPLEPAVPPVKPGRQCRFCGASMEPDQAFCPKCDRAQA